MCLRDGGYGGTAKVNYRYAQQEEDESSQSEGKSNSSRSERNGNYGRGSCKINRNRGERNANYGRDERKTHHDRAQRKRNSARGESQNNSSDRESKAKCDGRGLYSSDHSDDPDPGGKRRMKCRFFAGLETHKERKVHEEGAQDLLWSRIRTTLQEPFSEFLGVMILTTLTQGGAAQVTLSVGQASALGGNGYGSYLTVPFTYRITRSCEARCCG